MEPSSSSSMSISSTITVAAVMFVFVLAAFVFFIYVYARYKWGSSSAAHLGRVHEDAAAAAAATLATRTTGRGLDQEVLRSLPVLVFKKENRAEKVECSVCLSEIADGEKTRLLPKCNHCFHMECIGKWFRSHLTCPLCRNPVEADPHVGHSSEPRNLPTDVLFWGSQHRVGSNIAAGGGSKDNHEDDSSSSSSSSDIAMEGALVIDISDRMAGEETKSQAATPTLARLRSLKRFFSREKKAVAGSSSGSGGGESQHATAEDRVGP